MIRSAVAVIKLHLDLHAELHAGEAPGAKNDANGVGTLAELFGDIKRDIRRTDGILRDARLPGGVADLLAVDVQLEETQATDIRGGAAELFLEGEFAAEIARRHEGAGSFPARAAGLRRRRCW